MRKVERSDVLDFKTYNDQRDSYRERIILEKAKRRVHVGEYLTFLFESTATMLYQVQEMTRLEQIVREAEIQHEIDTYNQLLGEPGELGCTLLIEIDSQAERDVLLKAWLDLPAHLYVKLEGGGEARAIWDRAQIGETRLSSVQYLKFQIGDGVPVAIGADHPRLSVEAALTGAQRETLRLDLRAT